MDYEALAKQFGGTSVAVPPPPPTVDYAALAKKFGGTSDAPPAPNEGVALGRGVASLIDNTLGGIAPMAVQQFSYPFLRLGSNMNAEQAQKESERLASYVDKPVGKATGVTETPEYKNETSNAVMKFIAENLHKGAAWVAEKTGLPESDIMSMGGSLALGAPKAVKTAAPAINDAAQAAVTTAKDTGNAIAAKVAEIPAVKARVEKAWADKVQGSWDNAAMIESANLARKHNIAIDVSQSNPSAGRRLAADIVGGGDQHNRMSVDNAGKWNAAMERDLGVGPNRTPDKSYFESAQQRPEVAEPYAVARSIQAINVTPEVVAKIDSLRPEPLPGMGEQAAHVNTFLDKLQADLQAGPVSGAKMLDAAQAMRQEAQDIYKKAHTGALDATDRARARALMGAADALEDTITTSLGDAAAKAAFQKARVLRAQTFAYERATNPNTHQLDPNVLARMVEDGDKLTGVPAELAKIAGNHPNTSRIGVHDAQVVPRVSRATIGGAAGAGVGMLLGGGYPGAIAGAAIGGGVNEIARLVAAKYMRGPGYQERNLPIDYRTQPHPINSLLPPAEAPIAPMNALAPRGSPFSEQSAERVRQYQAQKAAEEAALAAEQNAPRAPTTGGTPLDFGQAGLLKYEPMTRTFAPPTPAPQVITSTRNLPPESPSALWSAAGKLSSHPASNQFASGLETLRGAPTSQPFALTAAEKVAWDKTRVDLAEVMPGFSALEPKVIAERMMDRAWVADAVKKAREKAEGYAAIAARDGERADILAAKMKRDQMLDLAESLEEGLRSPRAGSGTPKEQGPRTKAAIRKNNLAPENKNNLR